MTDSIPIEAFLESYPPPIRIAAQRLRRLVFQVEPDAIERVREGWRIIGYDLRVGRRTRYFAWIGPEPKHVHIGFLNPRVVGRIAAHRLASYHGWQRRGRFADSNVIRWVAWFACRR